MNTNEARELYGAFHGFRPRLWTPNCKGTNYSLAKTHGISSSYSLHNPNDSVNSRRNDLEKILVGYHINGNTYPLFSQGDLFSLSSILEKESDGNLIGKIAERIAWRMTKYFLAHLDPSFKPERMFDDKFDANNPERYVVASTDQFVLMVKGYPNMALLKKEGAGAYGYRTVSEFDGLFAYRYFRQSCMVILESKVENLKIKCDLLIDNLIAPLKSLFPDAKLAYVIFSDRRSIYAGGDRRNILKDRPVRIFERFSRENVGTVFFSFNESRSDFERIIGHLLTQYKALSKKQMVLRALSGPREIRLYDGGEAPNKVLVKVSEGLWKEIEQNGDG